MATKAKNTKQKAAEPDQEIRLPAIDIHRMKVTVVGDSSLISHAWSEKAKKMMLDKQMKKAETGKAAKDPFADFADSLYWMSDRPDVVRMQDIQEARFGQPAVAFKAAAVDACSYVANVTKVAARGAFHIDAELIEIQGPPPEMREDMVRIAMGTSDIRYRGEFHQWQVELPIRFNRRVLSAEQIVNLFNTAGFAVGVGDWRPQRNGSHGMFHVATDSEVSQ